MTKPGNSDPEEAAADKAPGTTTSDAKPAEGAEPSAETESAEVKPAEVESVAAESAESKPAKAKSAAVDPDEAKPAEVEPAEAKSAEPDPVEAEPAEAKPAKAKPAAKSAAAKAREARAAESGEPLMAELEKAPPPPREEQALRDQAKRRFEEPPPMPLRISFYLFIAAGLVFLVSMIMSLVFKQDFIDAQIELNKNPDITPEQITNAVNQILWIVTIAALAFTVFLGLFGYKATEGARRGRTLVTIFAVMLILFQLLLNGTLFGMLSAFLAAFGLALLWSRSARAYFPPRSLP